MWQGCHLKRFLSSRDTVQVLLYWTCIHATLVGSGYKQTYIYKYTYFYSAKNQFQKVLFLHSSPPDPCSIYQTVWRWREGGAQPYTPSPKLAFFSSTSQHLKESCLSLQSQTSPSYRSTEHIGACRSSWRWLHPTNRKFHLTSFWKFFRVTSKSRSVGCFCFCEQCIAGSLKFIIGVSLLIKCISGTKYCNKRDLTKMDLIGEYLKNVPDLDIQMFFCLPLREGD